MPTDSRPAPDIAQDATLPNPSFDAATRLRLRLLCVLLAVTAVAGAALSLLWPGGSDSGTVLTVDDVRSIRQAWWGMLMAGAVLSALQVPAQALVVLSLVRGRGATAATWGAAAMWIGVALETVGLAGFTTAYYFPSDPTIDGSASEAVFQAIAHDHLHLLTIQIPGHLLLTIGIVVQAVALLRARVTPAWIPLTSLAIVVTYAVPGSGAIGLVTTVPLLIASLGLARCAWRRTTP